MALLTPPASWRASLGLGLWFVGFLWLASCGGGVGEGQNLLLCQTSADCPPPPQGKTYTCILNLCQTCLDTGGPEICNGLDDNCDGKVDEGNPDSGKVCTVPGGKGLCTDGKTTCEGGKIVCKANNQPSPEICGNGLDDDCDGTIDNGCACKPGDTRFCYPDAQAGCTRQPDGTYFCKGTCKAGTQACQPDGTFGPCSGALLPVSETLSCGDGKDNDCDGQIDNGCQCSAGETRSCYPDAQVGCTLQPDKSYLCLGTCKAGTQACQPDGTFGPCSGHVTPVTEICDGLDNNCDGKTDENPPCECQLNTNRQCYDLTKKGCRYENDKYVCDGICKPGVQSCQVGKWTPCQNAVEPNPTELCGNGLDDNCDGKTDENPPCECSPGDVRTCYPGPDTGCLPASNPSDPHTCKGECKAGLQICNNLGKWLPCNGAVGPTSEACDLKDNNCDGQIDEGCGCTNGTSQLCGSNVGECKAGLQTCSLGQWGPCGGEVTPSTEICDGKDNNCDGRVDEGCNCINGATRPCGSNIGECRQGLETCSNGNWGSCTGAIGASTEICDLKDNNCNGQVDEGCSCTNGATQPCGSNIGECRQGTQTCSNGQWGNCTNDTKPATEICDNKDNDCDGKTDETLSQACYTGTASSRNKGECKDGTQICTSGTWGTCTGQSLPTTEICDNKDNDCDGSIDNGIAPRSCYSGPNGTQAVGECKAGTQICAAGAWGTCTGQILPTSEIANGKDDDCDGKVDEGVIPLGCKSGPNSQESSTWGSSMVACDCTTTPCSINTATTGPSAVCATGWQPCTLSQWKARFNGLLSSKRRYIRAKMVCVVTSPPKTTGACTYPINDDGSNNGKVFFTDGDLCDEGSTNDCSSTNSNRPMLFFVTSPNVVENSPGCTTPLTSAQQTYASSIGLVSRGNSVSTFLLSSGNKKNNCLNDTSNAVQGVMCCK